MKRIILLAILMASVGFMLASCEKDKAESSLGMDEWQIVSQDESSPFYLQIEDTTTYPVILSKRPPAKKYSTVYCYNQDYDTSNLTMYKTLKIRNLEGTIVQEWLYEDLRSDYFEDYSVQSSDSNGLLHGFYYRWVGNFDDMTPQDWNLLLVDANKHPEEGFDLPTTTDLQNLATILGDSKKIPQTLNLGFDGTYYPLFDGVGDVCYNTNNACIWLNPINRNIWPEYRGHDPNQVDGCGVTVDWYIPGTHWSDNMIVSYTNIRELRCNVRLVRTLSVSQW